MILRLSLFVALISLIACQTKAPVTTTPVDPPVVEETDTGIVEEDPEVIDETTKEPPVYVVAKISRSGCYGECPVYVGKFYSNGKVTYEGKKHVSNIGLFETEVPPATLVELIKAAKNKGYFEMADAYPVNKDHVIVDLPTTFTSFAIGPDSDKAIANNHDGPKELKQLEEYLDGLLDNFVWTRVEKTE